MTEKNKIYNLDCIEGIKMIPDKSVDLVLTDPPYNIGIAKWDKIDYYTSNGWKVGRNPMKDWKATVRQWNGRDNQKHQARPTRIEPIPDYTSPKTDTVDIDMLKERLAQLGKRT